jgi:hypothetical protein
MGMLQLFSRFTIGALTIGVAAAASAVTYGNTSPFETESSHSPNFVLGVQVMIPQAITLQSFGMIYGNNDTPSISNAYFGLYSSSAASGLPQNLVAVTNSINLNTAQTYDNIAFTSTPTVSAGTYWMMALYQSQANPRMSLLNSTSLVAYWSNSYSSGMPTTAPSVTTYQGQNFNYWVNGASVPEQASIVVVGLGALAIMARKRRRA